MLYTMKKFKLILKFKILRVNDFHHVLLRRSGLLNLKVTAPAERIP